ncbi:MAG: Fe(3+) ABC transporter substrate-binding protein [Alphaproteobacteria bacterium]|jgi:iron(III) transport system substrate-binding protein|nr:Fe(3+) ABC transporter substrate-binding protein [Alphaproteobacteria bacterium]
MKLRTPLAAALILAPTAATAAGEVNVYSYRQPFLVKPLFDAFTKESGIKVNVVFARKGLIKRLQAEGRNSPADLIFTTDIGRLASVVNAGLAQPVKTPALEKAVPANFRDAEGKWYGLTLRARVVYASKDRVKPGAITSYEELADPKWRGRICTRKGDHAYNIAMLAAYIDHHGEAKAEEWLRGVKANLARKPQGNDRAQVKAIMEGVCDLAVGNHYYMALMLQNEKQKAWGQSANIVFPTLAGKGTHMNVSGVMMTRHAPNRASAIKLMEFLTGKTAQGIYAQVNNEYPIDPGVKASPLLESWGKFKRDTTRLEVIARNRAAALKIVNKVGYNDGPVTN